MPHYYFHIFDEEGGVPDEEGITLTDDEAARAEAEQSYRDLRTQGSLTRDGRIEVVDEKGIVLFVVLSQDDSNGRQG